MSYFVTHTQFVLIVKKVGYFILINDNMMHYFSLKAPKCESFFNMCHPNINDIMTHYYALSQVIFSKFLCHPLSHVKFSNEDKLLIKQLI